ncbi:MAG: Hsp70 family protein [Polyangiaceae bacterium]|nr:Hsp70 family protein [Polyangiaceae bacterium]
MTIYGIDLGTTYTKVAYLSEDGDSRVITVPMGARHILEGYAPPGLRSAVALWTDPSGKPMACVGEEARRAGEREGLIVLEESKAQIGREDLDFMTGRPEARWVVPGQQFEYRPEDVAALILRRAKAMVDQQVPAHPMNDVVITFPQRFEAAPREATRVAGELAGLNVVETLTEPDAVGYHFGVENDEPGVSMIFDIGGGTTDINVVRYQDGKMEVLGSAGEHVAGRHFDEAILRSEVLPACYQASDGRFTEALLRTRPREFARFMGLAEQLKIHLSGAASNDAPVRLTVDSDLVPSMQSFDIMRTRAGVGEAVNALVDTCRRAALRAMAAAQKKDPSLDIRSLRTVYLVGGSSGLVWIRDMLAGLTGKQPRVSTNPSSAIAEGAAYFALRYEALRGARAAAPPSASATRRRPTMLNLVEAEVTTTMQRGLGLYSYEATSGAPYVQNLVPANTKLPHTSEMRFATAEGGEDEIYLEFMEGDSTNIEACTSAATCIVPLPKFAPGEALVIRIDVDHACRKKIVVVHASTGREYPAHLRFPEEAVVSEEGIPSRRAYLATVQLMERVPR